MDDIPYLARGVALLGTDSSVLISSSKYLNDPRLRDWIAKIALRRNGPDYPPAAETHDFEHILTGGGFNYMGELIPYWFRLGTIDKFIANKELAGEMNAMGILGTMRYVIRTVLHYPQVWGTALQCMEQGMAIARQSDAFWMAKMEDYWDLPLDQARAALGVRGTVDLDTHEAGAIWADVERA